jgi:hypothetical protein
MQSNIFVPYDPISPTPLTTDSSLPSSPISSGASPSQPGMRQISTPPVIHSPLPQTPFNASRLQSSIVTDASSLDMTSPTSAVPSARFLPVRSSGITSPSDTATTRSTSTASSFTPVVVGPASPAASARYGTPVTDISALSDVARSPTLDAASPPHSRVVSPFVAVPDRSVSAAMSPFVDAVHSPPVHALSPLSPFADVHPLSPRFNRSPSPVLLSPQDSSLHLPSESDMAILSPSLRSGMFSPGGGSDFDIESLDGSELDDWSSAGRRTPSPRLPF